MNFINNFLFKIRLDFEKFESDVLNSINEANGKRLEIEVKFQNIDALKNIAVTNNKSNFYCDFDNNDDALMISEANEEILDTSSMNIQTSDVNNNLNGISDEELYKLEENINQELSLNSIDSKLKQFLNQKFVKCKPDFTENCFGHLAADLVLDHTHFQIENNSVDNLFIKNQKCSIKICSPAAYSNDVNIHEYVKFEIFDPKKNAVNFELKGNFVIVYCLYNYFYNNFNNSREIFSCKTLYKNHIYAINAWNS